MTALICGSVAYDTVMVFEGHFKDHILADRIHMLNVAFLVPGLRRNFGGCAGNIGYNLKLLGGHAGVLPPELVQRVPRLQGQEGVDHHAGREEQGDHLQKPAHRVGEHPCTSRLFHQKARWAKAQRASLYHPGYLVERAYFAWSHFFTAPRLSQPISQAFQPG